MCCDESENIEEAGDEGLESGRLKEREKMVPGVGVYDFKVEAETIAHCSHVSVGVVIMSVILDTRMEPLHSKELWELVLLMPRDVPAPLILPRSKSRKP